jgi:hypothetical protein
MDTNSHATAFDGSQVEKHVAVSKILAGLIKDPMNSYVIITSNSPTSLPNTGDTRINIAHFTNKKEFDAEMLTVNSKLSRSIEFSFLAFKLPSIGLKNINVATEYTLNGTVKPKRTKFIIDVSEEAVSLKYVMQELKIAKETNFKYTIDEMLADVTSLLAEYPYSKKAVVVYNKIHDIDSFYNWEFYTSLEEAIAHYKAFYVGNIPNQLTIKPFDPSQDVSAFCKTPDDVNIPEPTMPKPAFKPLSGPEETIFECLHMSLIDMMRRSKPAGSPFTLLEITGMIGTILQNTDIDKYASLAKFYVSIDLVKLLNPLVKSKIVGFKFHDSEETMDKHFLNNLAYRFHKGDVAKYCLTFGESASNVFNLEYLGVVSVLGLELEMDDSADRALDQSKANTKNNARLEFMRYCSDVTMLLNSFYLHIKPVGHEYSSSFNACNIVDKVQYVFQVHRESLPENGVLIKHSVDFNNYYLEFTIKNTNGKISLMGYMSCKGLKDTELEAIISNYLFDDKLPATAIVL